MVRNLGVTPGARTRTSTRKMVTRVRKLMMKVKRQTARGGGELSAVIPNRCGGIANGSIVRVPGRGDTDTETPKSLCLFLGVWDVEKTNLQGSGSRENGSAQNAEIRGFTIVNKNRNAARREAGGTSPTATKVIWNLS